MPVRVVFFGIVALLALGRTSGGQVRDRFGMLRYEHRECVQGVVFVPVDLDSLASLLPRGLRPMDAAPFHASFAGHGAIAVIHHLCRGTQPPRLAHSFTLIATPLDSVAIEGRTFGQVRFDWFELGRFVDTSPRAAVLRRAGVAARVAHFSTSAPPSDSAPEASFAATEGSDSLYRFDVVSRTAVDFPPQAHRFWHFRNERFGYSQMTFPLHHSWIGQAPSCSFYGRLATAKHFGWSPCVEKFALSELIPNVAFEETIVRMGAASLRPKRITPSR